MPKGNPIPVKFDYEEEQLIKSLSRSTGLSVSEIVRRAVRLLRYEMSKRSGAEALNFLITELAPSSRAKRAKKPRRRHIRNRSHKNTTGHNARI
jgi:hypothetical protein